jgi:glycosyltransferase involved in cell wall biosynthesis
LLSACDIGLLISPSEGMSNSVIEYMASGLPVVATDIPSNREVLGDAYPAQFCKPREPDDLAERLIGFITNRVLREEVGKRNQERARQVFSVEAMCEQTISIIEAALDAR